jgi:hypothetical protein
MLGFGPLGATPLGGVFDADGLARTSEIMATVVTRLVAANSQFLPPKLLYYFTSLEVARHILEEDDVRLTHAEYSNDQMEMEAAKTIIGECLAARAGGTPFFRGVETNYMALAAGLDAYIFCLSTGAATGGLPQDRLSQWRAYGQDGRGICLTLAVNELASLVFHTPGLRINPVIYDRATQTWMVNEILSEGLALHTIADPNALSATVGALVFATPLMKAPGFEEECEWRLVFMPPRDGPQPQLKFHPRRDFLAPFLTMQYIWSSLRPQLASIPALRPNPPLNRREEPNANPLIPVTEVMVGPSGHQFLNLRAITKLLSQTGRALTPTASRIPYRSLG